MEAISLTRSRTPIPTPTYNIHEYPSSESSYEYRLREGGGEEEEEEEDDDLEVGEGLLRKGWRSKSRSATQRLRRICAGRVMGGVFAVMILLSLAQLIHILLSFSAAVWAGDVQNYLKSFEGSDQQWYPTGFTRDVHPKGIHSHNDYWRKVPLFDAISVGAISVEADLWHFDGDEELYVGHDRASLTKNRTLNSLYLDPLREILARQNPDTGFVGGNTSVYNGVFDTNPMQTLYLYLDIKTDALPTYNSILRHLVPLHPFLTNYNSLTSAFHSGPLTIVHTGNSPFEAIASSENSPRYGFYDAPLPELGNPNSPYNNTNCIMATCQFSKVIGWVMGDVGMSEGQKEHVRRLIGWAHDKGMGARFWDTPGWPVRRRRRIWRELVEMGVDLLNVDDLVGAASLSW